MVPSILLKSEKIFSARWFRDYLLVIVGTFLISLGYVLFVNPNKIVPGGIYGISIVLHHLSKGWFAWAPDGLPLGITSLCFNIPLTIIGTRILGPKFGAKTVVAFVATSIYVEMLMLYNGDTPLVTDVLVSCIFGGLLIGLGVAMTFKAKATSGGTDVIAMLLSKFLHRPMGQMMMIVDACVVIIGFIAFADWQIPLYSWITIYVMGRVIDTALHGLTYEKTLFIVSDKHEEIRERLVNDIQRGGTFLHGEGMYNQTSKKMIFTVVSPRELSILQEYIHEIDPDAFITVLDAYETLGKGFKSLKTKLDK